MRYVSKILKRAFRRHGAQCGGAGTAFVMTLCCAVAVLAIAGVAGAGEMSEYHAMHIDPFTKKQLGPGVLKSIDAFFEDAERAIEGEDVDALMALYSEHYRNGDHRKGAAKAVWKRIFSEFDEMATIHNMSIETYSPGGNVMMIRCSGLLMGKPAKGKELITIDAWTNETHVLANENGKWKLIGTSGKKRKRLWFDKPMHPLF